MQVVASNQRSGLSLLEVIVSTAIFFLSVIAIYGLLDMGQRSGVSARQRGQALRIVQAKLAEVGAGVLALEASSGEESTCPGYQWEVSCDPYLAADSGLMKVTGRAFHMNEPKRSLVSLCQIVMSPSSQGSLMDAVPPPTDDSATAESSSSADSSSSSSSTSTSGSGSTPVSGSSASAPKASGSSSGASKPSSSSSGSGSFSSGSKSGTSSGSSSSSPGGAGASGGSKSAAPSGDSGSSAPGGTK